MASLNPRDLTISVRAATRSQHVLNGGPEGAVFPGWFLHVQENEGYKEVVPVMQIEFDYVKVFTTKLDEFADFKQYDPGGRSNWRITHAAESCEKAMQDDLIQQLQIAENAAAKIPELKRRLGINAD